MKPVIAITGGIGTGKSVVSKILRISGYEVFDCDSEAKRIMEADDGIKRRLCEEIDELAVVENVIDRRHIAEIVFNDAQKLAALNAIVHQAVREEIMRRAEASKSDIFFVETAIFYQSGLNSICDAEWRVSAPLELRISRVIRRNNLTRAQVEARIEAQNFVPNSSEPTPVVAPIINDERTPLLPQILNLLAR